MNLRSLDRRFEMQFFNADFIQLDAHCLRAQTHDASDFVRGASPCSSKVLRAVKESYIAIISGSYEDCSTSSVSEISFAASDFPEEKAPLKESAFLFLKLFS